MSSPDDQDRLKVVGDYKHGSIKCVKLTNFLTYSYVEFNAGPRFVFDKIISIQSLLSCVCVCVLPRTYTMHFFLNFRLNMVVGPNGTGKVSSAFLIQKKKK